MEKQNLAESNDQKIFNRLWRPKDIIFPIEPFKTDSDTSSNFLSDINTKVTWGDHGIAEANSGLAHRPLLASLLLVFLYVIFVLVPYALAGSRLLFPQGMKEPLFSIVAFGTVAILWFLVVPFGLHLPSGRESFKQYLDRIHVSRIHPVSRNLILGISCALVFLMCVLAAGLLTDAYVFDLTQILPPISWVLLTALTPGIWEEVAFRGVILVLLLKKYEDRTAIILSAILFSVPHLMNLLGIALTLESLSMALAQVAWAFSGGLFLAYLRIETGSLLPGILIHYLIVALGPVLTYTPGADPVLKGILLILGLGIIPSIINLFMYQSISKRWPLNATFIQK